VTDPLAAGNPDRNARWHVALIFLGALLLHSAGTWILPITDRDEARFAEASREMIERGDWVVPWFNNQPRYDKPPLIYWAQIAAYRLLGESEFAARLPSVIAAALTAVAIYGFGRRMRGARTGIWAAIFYTTSLQVIVNSRMSVADPLMILFFTTGAWSAWETGRPLPGNRAPATGWHAMFAASLALAFLAKGPVGWLPLLLPILTAVWMREAIAWRRLRLHWIVPAALGAVALWGVPALMRTQGEFWAVGMGKHVFQRSLIAMEGHGGARWMSYVAMLPYFFLTVFVSFFPWSMRLVGLFRGLRERRAALGYDERFLITGTVLVFAVFTLVRTKLPHYTLPAFPLLSLLLSCALTGNGGPPIAARRWAIGMAGFGVVVGLVGSPILKPWFASAELAEGCQPWLRPEMEIATGTFNEPSLCWNFRKTLRTFVEYGADEALPAFMARPGPRLCILPTSQAAQIFGPIPEAWKSVRAEGINVANGKRADLTALIQP
jgi:4-amino-4-deoxy-L-arabinose transferase-like glycosyltransferase